MVEEKKEERKEEDEAHVAPIHPEDERGGKRSICLVVKRVADHNFIIQQVAGKIERDL